MTDLGIIVKLLSSNDFKRLTTINMVGTPQSLDVQCSLEQNRAEALAHRLNFNETYLIDILLQLDFMTYIPFGTRGMRQIEKYLKHSGNKKTYAEYKYDQMIDVLKNNNIEVNSKLVQGIKNYCKYLITDEQDLSKAESIAATVRKIGGELENLASLNKINGMRERTGKLRELVNQLYEDTKKGITTICLNKYLSNHAEKLNDTELEYFNKVIDLKVTNNKEIEF